MDILLELEFDRKVAIAWTTTCPGDLLLLGGVGGIDGLAVLAANVIAMALDVEAEVAGEVWR